MDEVDEFFASVKEDLASGTRRKWKKGDITVSLIPVTHIHPWWRGFEVMAFGEVDEGGNQYLFSQYADALAYAESLVEKYGINRPLHPVDAAIITDWMMDDEDMPWDEQDGRYPVDADDISGVQAQDMGIWFDETDDDA